MKNLLVSCLGLASLCVSAVAQTQTTNVFNNIPQFGIYNGSMPANYTPPPGVAMFFLNGVWYTLVKLTPVQQQGLGSDLSAKITYSAGCDVFDRNAALIYVAEQQGIQPSANDIANKVTMSHFITPFSAYNQSEKTYVFPLASIKQYASSLADSTHDIWVGIAGGSNPTYPNAPTTYNPCYDSNGKQNPNLPVAPYPTGLTTAQGEAIFAQTGFSYSLDLTWTQAAVTPNPAGAITAFIAAPGTSTQVPLSNYSYGGNAAATFPMKGTITVPGSTAVTGTVTLVTDGHGGGAEYMFNTSNTLAINGTQVGSPFSTQADCAPYGPYSPIGNPGIFNNTTGSSPSNARNWCPGAIVRPTETSPGTPNPTSSNPGTPMAAQVFTNVTLHPGSNTFTFNLGAAHYDNGPYNPANGDAYVTTLNFVPTVGGTTQTATTLSLTASPNSITIGQSTVLKATLAPASTSAGAATGTVQFYSNGIALGGPVTISGNVASLTVGSGSTAKTVAITAVYSGDANYKTSTAPAVSVTIH